MTKEDPYLDDKIALIADFVGRDFMRLAKELQQVQEQRSDMFIEVADRVGIGRRKAFALARIARIVEELGIPDERLNRIGWAKLNRISGHLNEDNAIHLLALAEESTSTSWTASSKANSQSAKQRSSYSTWPSRSRLSLQAAAGARRQAHREWRPFGQGRSANETSAWIGAPTGFIR